MQSFVYSLLELLLGARNQGRACGFKGIVSKTESPILEFLRTE